MPFTRVLTATWISLGLVAVTPVAAPAQESVDLDQSELIRLMLTAPPAPQRPALKYYTDGESSTPENRAVVGYDVATGRVTRSPAAELREPWKAPPPDPPFSGLIPAYVEQDVGLESRDITPTPPTPHADNTSYPWRTMYKMVMRFNVGGDDHFYGCTGWSSGSFHVVTAGHCIFNWDPNDDGSDSDAKWADEVWLFAGQGDEVAPIDDPDLGVDWPYGIAKAVKLRSYEGWTDWENHSHDWGVITLNRRTGDHVGWMGRESDCGNSLNFSGYPTETPYVPPDTVVQFYGYDPGNVDYCWIHRIGLNAYMYGGHSGGPSWRYDTTSEKDYVEGIHSTSSRTGDTQETRLTDGKRADLNAWMATDETDRPPTARPDLQEYFLGGLGYKDLITPSVSQGENIRVEYNAYNSGHATATGAEVAFYLSTDLEIDTSDHAIGTRTHDIAAGGAVNRVAALTVPTSVPTGTYYVGWILSWSGTEYSTRNNAVVINTEMLTVREERDITVTAPNGGEEWPAGYSRKITWTWTDAGSDVRIEVTHNGGIGWDLITASTPNDGSYTWTVTGPASTLCRIRITSTAYPTLQDESDADFRIVDRTITVTYPTDPVVWFISEAQFVG